MLVKQEMPTKGREEDIVKEEDSVTGSCQREEKKVV